MKFSIPDIFDRTVEPTEKVEGVYKVEERKWSNADMIDFADFIYSHWKHGGGFPSNDVLFHLWEQGK